MLARKEGAAEGALEGARKKAIESATNLLKMNILSREQIAETTGLSIEEVEEIAKGVER